jgi:hypothetical protein
MRSNVVTASFSQGDIKIPPLELGATKLTIKSKLDLWWNFSKPSTNTESLPIVANVTLPKAVKYNFLDAFTNITGREIIGPGETVGLPITVFNGYEYILNILNSLSAPVNVYLGAITAIAGAIGGWILNRTKNKKDSEDTSVAHHKLPIPNVDEIRNLADLKEEGIEGREENEDEEVLVPLAVLKRDSYIKRKL